jgi:hypothetical protein
MANDNALHGSFTVNNGVVTGWAAYAIQPTSRQTVAILANGVLVGEVLAQNHFVANDALFDNEHGFSFTLPADAGSPLDVTVLVPGAGSLGTVRA